MSQQLPPNYQQPQYYQQPRYQPPMQPGGYPPPQPPKKKPRRVAIPAIFLIIGFIIVVTAIQTNRNSNSTVVATATSQSTSAVQQSTTAPTDTPTPAPHNYKVGDIVSVDNTWQVQFTKITIDRTGDQYTQPKNGNVYLVAHTIVKNISAESRELSSLNFTLRDTSGNEFNDTFTMKYKEPSGTVVVGEQLQGDLVYEVPASTKSYNLYFQTHSYTNPAEWDVRV